MRNKKWRLLSSLLNFKKDINWWKWEDKTKMELFSNKRKTFSQFLTVSKAVQEQKNVWVEKYLRYNLLTWRMSKKGIYIQWWSCLLRTKVFARTSILCCFSISITSQLLSPKKSSASAFWSSSLLVSLNGLNLSNIFWVSSLIKRSFIPNLMAMKKMLTSSHGLLQR